MPKRRKFFYCENDSDILENEDIKLDWMFKLSIITDIINGMEYIHNSPIKSHGKLKSSNCVVDSRWVCKITDYGLWNWYEGDVNVDDIGEQEIYKATIAFIYSLLTSIIYSGRKIVSLVQKCEASPFRPSVMASDTQVSKPMEELMGICWHEDPKTRMPFKHIKVYVKNNNKVIKGSIMDNMLKMLEKYANNLEDLVETRTQELLEEKEKTNQLLYKLIPKSVAEKLKRGEIVYPEAFDAVTIFFSDIVGFTTIAARCSPMEVVDLLNGLYTLFDDIIDKFDVYKVETIGDAYMVVSGLPNRNGDKHAGEIATMSLTILSKLQHFEIKNLPDEKLMVRIGLHSGPVCAGIVGLTMPRYCLFGDTVNTASRMESNGKAQKIHISAQCKLALMKLGGYYMGERGEINIKVHYHDKKQKQTQKSDIMLIKFQFMKMI
ncbi:hypothetical protein KUTeg_010462 [Tegillarca granosa]|uniref:Guanylate cyclase n=1 Tax=Tegillarca granosa TaxID=220873 RepID=A0ABQ9F6S9_TEGGR|nr:hypothetical protein KUTeg_010462 [Tegillarca granosa]